MHYKKTRLIPLIVLFIIFISTARVRATNASIILDGSANIEAGKKYKVNITLSSDESIGVLSGKIKTSSNIKTISVVAKNNWNLTYNEKTGDFNIYKAEGSKNENVMELEYTVNSGTSGEEKISIDNSKVTTINYETINKGTVSKKLSIYNNGNNSDKDASEDNNNNQSEKNNNSNKSSKKAQIINKKSKKDITVSDKDMPKTGKKCIINILIVIITIIAIILYKKNNEYKGL